MGIVPTVYLRYQHFAYIIFIFIAFYSLGQECPYPYIDIGEGDHDEDGTSPSTMRSTLDNMKKELSFDKGDEQKSE